MQRSIYALALLLVSTLAYGDGPWPRSDGGKIKIINPKAMTLKNGCYLNEKLVNSKTRTFVERSKWVSHFFPLPMDFEITKIREGYKFSSARNVSTTPVHFLFNFELNEKNGTYEGFVCVKDSQWVDSTSIKGCITEISVESENAYSVRYGKVVTTFININGFTSETPQTTEFGPCQWP